MPRSKKPDAPKFEPVTIAGIRPGVYSLLKSEAESRAMLAEDNGRILLQRTTATLERLDVLQKYLGLSGKLGDVGNLLVLLTAVANKYVPGFPVAVGAVPKRGAKKVADRFKTVAEVQSVKLLQNLPTDAAAIDAVAATRRPAIQSRELSTKYYASLREIEASPQAAALLMLWQRTRQAAPATDDLHEFESLFWQCEHDCLGAVQPHNVTPLRLRN
jgi:hypothetical protein